MPVITEPYAPGTPCWIDLMVPDQQAALDYYRDLFGWQGEIGPPETGGYSVCTLNGHPVAGVMATQPGNPTPPVWTTYLATADAAATEAAISASGGTVIAPAMDVMDLGRMLVFSDPTGAVAGAWQAGEFAGAKLVNEPGTLIWSELSTSDPDRAGAFYQAALNLTAAPMQGAEDYLAFSVDGRPVGGLQSLENHPAGTPSHWMTYFAVDDVDSTVAAHVRAGGDVLVPAFDMMAGRMAALRDPQGAIFSVFKPAPPS